MKGIAADMKFSLFEKETDQQMSEVYLKLN